MEQLSVALKARGLIYQHSSPTLEEITDSGTRTLYMGVDPTADSLTVGHLQMLLVMRRFHEAGHKVILVLGGGTGMIGDPSGKSEERVLLDDATIEHNLACIREQAKIILDTEDITVVNNGDWLRSLSLIEFLRDVGKHFSVNVMLTRDSVRERLQNADQGISYTEFSYALLQSYDFYHLNKEYNCDLQIGASDQWGNIVAGADFIRKKTGRTAYALTSPLLINKATGKKFGKSEGGAVWLDPAKTAPFKFYQFWFNSEDDAVEEYLMKMTMMPLPQIAEIMSAHTQEPGKRIAQKALAREITTLVHGEETAQLVESVSAILFGDTDLSEVSAPEKQILLEEAPHAEVVAGEKLTEVLVKAALATSKREARQFIEDKAVSVSGVTVTDPEYTFKENDFASGLALLKRGKRSICVLSLQ